MPADTACCVLLLAWPLKVVSINKKLCKNMSKNHKQKADQHTLILCSCRADNVGDNVGDIAGMGADLFGSFAESTCAALVISSVSSLGTNHLYQVCRLEIHQTAHALLVLLLSLAS